MSTPVALAMIRSGTSKGGVKFGGAQPLGGGREHLELIGGDREACGGAIVLKVGGALCPGYRKHVRRGVQQADERGPGRRRPGCFAMSVTGPPGWAS
jgi:hypothetical protein